MGTLILKIRQSEKGQSVRAKIHSWEILKCSPKINLSELLDIFNHNLNINMDVSELLIERKMERIEGWLLDLAADNDELRQRFRENRLDTYGHMASFGRDMDRVIDRVNELADKTKKGFKRAREQFDADSDYMCFLDYERQKTEQRIEELEAAAESLGTRIKELEANCNDRMEKLAEELHDKYTGRVEWWQKCAQKLEEKEQEIQDEVRCKMEAAFACIESSVEQLRTKSIATEKRLDKHLVRLNNHKRRIETLEEPAKKAKLTEK